ncbi:MAG: ATP-binding protein [bacterium]
MKVLIADDDPFIHEILTASFTNLGDETICVVDGQEAWKKVEEDKSIKLCILDWMMPGIEGIELCKRIRNLQSNYYKYIIFLTSRTHSKDILEGLKAGADDYIIKPFNLDEVIKRILVGRRIIALEDNLLSIKFDLEKKNKRLLELNELKSNFISIVSHELRTPLTSIKNAITIILEGRTGSITNDQQRFLQMVERNAERLAQIINDLLDISGLESGKMELRFQKMELASSLEIALQLLKNNLEKKSIIFKNQIPPSLPQLYADPARVSQILIKLIENAIKFIPPDNEISISARNLELPFIEVCISDTGRGLHQEELKNIFDKFYQVSKATTREVGGIGLGLSIIKKLVERHKGKIWVESEVGKGSCFIFTLPRWEENEGCR